MATKTSKVKLEIECGPNAIMVLPYAIQALLYHGGQFSEEEEIELSEETHLELIEAGEAIMKFVERNI